MNNLDSRGIQQARRAFFNTSLRTCAAVLALACHGSSSGRAETATPPSAPASAVSQSSPAGEGPLRAGVARTPEEVVRCREMENARANGRAVPRVALPAEPVRLRSTPLELTERGCADAARQWNFYSYDNDATGCFVNAYVKGRDVVSDLATGLMWEQGTSPDLLPFEEAEQYVLGFNRKKLAGFSNWRLPTTEELLSLLEVFPFRGCRPSSYLDVQIFECAWDLWASDYSATDKAHWGVDVVHVVCVSSSEKMYVRAVRTMSKQELEEARKKLEKGK